MTTSNTKTKSLIAAALSLACAAAFAQSPPVGAPHDVHRQARDENGSRGVSDSREAARLHRQVAQLERLRAQSLRDGHLSRAERAELRGANDRLRRDIAIGVRQGVLSRREAARLERSITPVVYRETVNLPPRY